MLVIGVCSSIIIYCILNIMIVMHSITYFNRLLSFLDTLSYHNKDLSNWVDRIS